MPAATPAKRALADNTKNRANVQVSPRSVKRAKFDHEAIKSARPAPKQFNGFNSSQPKSQFEEEVLEKLSQDMVNLKQKNSEKDQQWARPSLDDFNDKTQSLCFQQIEIEEGALSGGKTAIKLFGVTETGHSVLLHVTDFLHYFFVAAPIGFGRTDCDAYKTYLESECQKSFNSHSAVIHSVQMTMKENMYGFQGNQKSPYLKIVVTDPRWIGRTRKLVQEGSANWKQLWVRPDGGILTFDNIQYVMRFMVDTKVRSSWFLDMTWLTCSRYQACLGSKSPLVNIT